MQLADYTREYLCQVSQFLEYVEDAIVSPEQTDFDVLLKKIEQIRAYAPFIEKLLGIQRKDPYESRKNSSASQAPSGKKEPGKNDQRNGPRHRGTQERKPQTVAKARGVRKQR